MTYRELYETATRQLEKSEITLGEYEEMAKPLDEEIHKKGKWIKVTNGRGGHECSICREYAPSYQNGDEYLSNHCPNCGAEMESAE